MLHADDSSDAKVHDYPDLFRDAADALRDASLYSDALRFYEPLQQVPHFANASYFANMALCYQAVGEAIKAEEFYRLFLSQRSSTLVDEARPDDDKMDIANCVILAEHQSGNDSKSAVLGALNSAKTRRPPLPLAMLVPPPSKQSLKRQQLDKQSQAERHGETLRTLYRRTQELLDRARAGNAEALVQWMAAVQELADDFRSHRRFYPHDRGPPVYGRSTSSVVELRKTSGHQDAQGNPTEHGTRCGQPPHYQLVTNVE